MVIDLIIYFNFSPEICMNIIVTFVLLFHIYVILNFHKPFKCAFNICINYAFQIGFLRSFQICISALRLYTLNKCAIEALRNHK